ncbi:hypothetical protein [Alkaliphilus peptidifermentans]|uniref:DUF304 domain-containing protein n=1 Tax=Alkaliphilus peptidifermentans DSM 18978 TaxID=1120976 RepID=A0A1G5JE42_9FIRM|nr:hypothetical protein [Alkaliphilus peptidifermentans]SCY86605.1 hypothetical protein SAMN03080606_02795 [Alkaliphilus peptidifermentans DSM 18978]
MDEKIICIQSSFKGIIGSLLFLLFKLLITIITYSFFIRIKNNIFHRYNMGFRDSLVSPLATKLSLTDFALLNLSYIAIALLIAFLGVLLYEILSLLMESHNRTTFDCINNKIIINKSISLVTRIDEVNLFYKVILVRVSQNYLQKLLNTGNLYVELLSLSEIDFHITVVEIKYIESPFEVKKQLI